MLLNSHISASTRCVAEKVCRLVRSTCWGTSQGEDKLRATDKILNAKVARRACAERAPGKHPPHVCEANIRANLGNFFGTFFIKKLGVHCVQGGHCR